MNLPPLLPLGAWLLYLSLGPIYWLPGVPPNLLLLAKAGMAGVATLLTIGVAFGRGRFALPTGWVGLLAPLVLVPVSLGGFLQTDFRDALLGLLDYGYLFAVLWSLYLVARLGGNPYFLMLPPALVLAAAASVVVLQAVTGVPGWRAPAVFNGFPLTFSGFGSLRTGWSNALSLYLPVLLILLSTRYRNLLTMAIAAAGIAAILGSQFVVGGRAGLLASLGVLALWAWLRLPRTVSLGLGAAATLFVIVGGSYVVAAGEALRFSELFEEDDLFLAADDVAAGRLTGYLYALGQIAERPFIGHGFGEVLIDGTTQIHNIWLRLAAEGGVPVALVFGAIVVTILLRAWRIERVYDAQRRAGLTAEAIDPLPLFLVLVAGLIAAMFEPNMLLGSFQNSAFWWAAAGIMIGVRPSAAGTRSAVSPPPRTARPVPVPLSRPNVLGA